MDFFGEKPRLEISAPLPSHARDNSVTRAALVVPPPLPAKDDGYRPTTASTRRLSFSTTASSRRTIKYGTGKHAATELSPQPSDDPEDPMNWPQWKKELNLAALLLTVGLIGGMKTAFISTNSIMATTYGVSYSSVAALTAVPLILSAFTGMASLIASKLWGKRPVYLVSAALVFIGSMWNMRTLDSFAQCMAARAFQGLGWGAFDTLVLGSIHDTYFEHQRGLRLAMYNVLSVATTWGSPLFGGLASQNAQRFTIQYEIINCFQIFALPLIALCAYETAFDRSWSVMMGTPASTFRAPHPLIPRGRLTRDRAKRLAKDYLRTVPLVSYAGERDSRTVLQAPRAFIAPTTALLFIATFLPYCSLWGFSESFSLLFTTAPLALSPGSLGSLMVGVFCLATSTVAAFAFYRSFHANFSPRTNVITLAAGTCLVVTGLLAFGLDLHKTASEIPRDDDGSFGEAARAYIALNLSYPLLGILLGLLAAGTYVLNATVCPLIWRSTQFTSSNLNVCIRNVADMNAGVTCWRNLFAGIFVMVLPGALQSTNGLKSNVIGISVAQVLVTAGVAALWWFYDENIRRMDGNIMGLIDLSMLKRAGSFFDHD